MTRIGFCSSALIPANPPPDFDTGLHQLDPLQGRTPDWSPNDRFLTFESKRGCLNGNYAIFIEASTTGKAVQVTDCQLNANHAAGVPQWTPFRFLGGIFHAEVVVRHRMPRDRDRACAEENSGNRNR